MKVGLALDGVLTDARGTWNEWARRLGEDFTIDESFWASLKPYEDAGLSLRRLAVNHQTYVFAERPKAMSLVTRTWINNHCRVLFDKDHLVMQAIKRYDCRLLGIDVFIDSNPYDIENLKVETVCPVRTYHVDRAGGMGLLPIVEELCQ